LGAALLEGQGFRWFKRHPRTSSHATAPHARQGSSASTTAFAVRHPAVTSAVIESRTIDHLDGYLAADGIELSPDVLDLIDQIVAPGVTGNVADNMWSIAPARLVRRPALVTGVSTHRRAHASVSPDLRARNRSRRPPASI